MSKRRGAFIGGALGLVQVLALHANVGFLEVVLRPAAFVEFTLLLLVSTFLPRGSPRPLGLMVPEFHWTAVPLADALFIAMFALAGYFVERLWARRLGGRP